MTIKYKVLALVGPAGAGKDTICNEIVNNYKYNKIISYTTRPARSSETEGKDYYFVTKEEFDNLDLLEYTIFKENWYYGTSTKSLKANTWNIGVFNPEGINSLKQREDIDLLIWYVKAKDINRIKRQLLREKKPSIKEIIRRYFADKKDFKNFDSITDWIVYNDTEQQLHYNICDAKFLSLQLDNKKRRKSE